MAKVKKPTTITALLFAATLTLVGGTVAAALLPSHGVLWVRTHSAAKIGSAAPATASIPSPPANPPATATPTPSRKPAPAPRSRVASKPLAGAPAAQAAARPPAPITYTVKPGDTLSAIAAWFTQQGYGALYAANLDVIGGNPDLIRPGERITISRGVMTFHGP